MKKVLKVILIILLTAIISVLFPLIAKLCVEYVQPRITQDYLINNLTTGIIFYTVQTGLSILFVKIILKKSLSEMGFNTHNKTNALKIIKWFLGIWLILVTAFYTVAVMVVPDFSTYIKIYYVKDTSRLVIDIIKGCLLAGIGEEPLFRGVVILLLTCVISISKNEKRSILAVALLSGVFFSAAHIAYNVFPFEIVLIDYVQLTITFILGTFWAVLYMRTKSLVWSIIAHSCANTIQILMGYFVAYFIL